MDIYYSAVNKGFYHGNIRADYERAGTWPNDAILLTEIECNEYHMQQPPEGMKLDVNEKGRPEWVALPEKALDELAARKSREIETARDEAINAGFTHTFGGTDDVVQTRQRDRENLTGLAVSAQRHTEDVFHFRAQSNATYELTASEMLALADAAQAHVSQQYAHSWQLKAEIDAALEAEDRDTLEAITW